MKIISYFIKKIILNTFIIYTYNVLAINFNLNLPINAWTMGFVGIFDIPGLIILNILKILGG